MSTNAKIIDLRIDSRVEDAVRNAMDIYIRSNQKPLKETFKSLRSKLYNNSKYYLKRKKDQIDALCSDT